MQQQNSRCIVLHTIQYKDNLSIVHLYSENSGRISCFLPISRGKKASIKSNLFQPFSVINLNLQRKPNNEIYTIKEAQIAFPITEIPYHPIKSAIALFLAEVLYRGIREHEENSPLFIFLENSIRILDLCENGYANFHIVFLIKLTAYIGFFPNNEFATENRYFDMLNGVFVVSQPLHNHYLNKQNSVTFANLLRMNYENMAKFNFNKTERGQIIELILEYYTLHLHSFSTIKSLDILKMLF